MLVRLRDRRLRVEGEVRIDLRRDPARHDAGKLGPEGDREPVADRSHDGLARAALPAAPSRAPPRRCGHEAGFSTALSRRVGFVVQSCGLRRRTASRSPVSATTTVMARNCSSFEGMAALPIGSLRFRAVRLHRVKPPLRHGRKSARAALTSRTRKSMVARMRATSFRSACTMSQKDRRIETCSGRTGTRRGSLRRP